MTKTTCIILIILYYSNVVLTVPNEEFDCTGSEDDSYHPFYDDCLHYWHCLYVGTVYQRAVLRECPDGTKFDADLKKCETDVLVTCLPRPTRPSTTTRRKWKFSRVTYHRRPKFTVSIEKIPLVSETKFSTKVYVKKLNAWLQKGNFLVPTDHHHPRHTTISNDNDLNHTIAPLITEFDFQVLTTLPAFPFDRFTPKSHGTTNIQSRFAVNKSNQKLLQPGEPNEEGSFYSSISPSTTLSTLLTTSASVTMSSEVMRDTTTLSKSSMTTDNAFDTSQVSTEHATTIGYAESTEQSTLNTEDHFQETTETVSTIKQKRISKKLNTTVSFETSSSAPKSLHDHHSSHEENNSITLLPIDIINARRIIHQFRSRPRRSNMTLYVLTSDEHKIRRFSLNQTRGLLMPLNLCKSRRLRDMSNTNTLKIVNIDEQISKTHNIAIKHTTFASCFQFLILYYFYYSSFI